MCARTSRMATQRIDIEFEYPYQGRHVTALVTAHGKTWVGGPEKTPIAAIKAAYRKARKDPPR